MALVESKLIVPAPAGEKIVLLILDGLGDIPHPDHEWKTPLEAAWTPNLDKLTQEGALGRLVPVEIGITPGSGPAHLGLFGYDPLEVEIGRGVLEALGIGIDLTPGDLAARANFATIDDKGVAVDRRAGRIPTEKNAELCDKLRDRLDPVEEITVEIQPAKEHRFVMVFRGEGLGDGLSDADPHREGLPIPPVRALRSEAEKAARVVNAFLEQVREVLKDEQPANAVLLRGLSLPPSIALFPDRFQLRSAAIVTYPMYRGLARLVGMDIVETGESTGEEFQTYLDNYEKFDYFFIHVKGTDAAGEDGDFVRKIEVIEEVDRKLPILLSNPPAVLAVTGDHSTPVMLKSHSWHPVPLLVYSRFVGSDTAQRLNEKEAIHGGLGTFYSRDLMKILQANARRLDKFGA